MNWISVKDRLPEKDDTYLVAVEIFDFDGRHLNAYIGFYDIEDKDWTLDCCTLDYVVTHWMPLPRLPEE